MRLALRALALLLCLPSAAGAQDDDQDRSFVLELFRPPLDADGFLSLEGTRTPGSLLWNVGMHLHYAEGPLALETTDLVDYSLGMDFVFAIGIADRFELGVGLPVVISQQGDLEPVGGGALASVGFGDLRLALKWSIIDNRQDGPGLAAILSGTAPIGDRDSFLGEGTFTLDPRLAADFKILNIVVGANVGYRLRGEATRFKGLRVGDELLFGAALRVPLALRGKLVVLFDFFGATAATEPFGESGTTPMEADGGLRLALVEDLVVQASGGWGIGNGYGTPVFRVGGAVTWAPRVHDADSDGIPDGQERCARIAEDQDGFEDDDGCPEPDNDQDGVYDFEDHCPEAAVQGDDADGDGCTDQDPDGDGVQGTTDQCPSEAEDRDDFGDEDGCPDPDNDGDGVVDAEDRCPADRGDPRSGGCPTQDSDHDEVAGEQDRCPQAPEDRDGFEDDDGCPDHDNDRDGVADAADRCPAELETVNGVTDTDGCPDRGGRVLARLAQGTLVLGGPLAFDRAGAPAPVARAVLDQLALVLLASPAVRVVVTGPTGAGSIERAAAVKGALVERGVGADRITTLPAPAGSAPDRNARISVE